MNELYALHIFSCCHELLIFPSVKTSHLVFESKAQLINDSRKSIYKLINQSEQVFKDRCVYSFGGKRVLSAKL